MRFMFPKEWYWDYIRNCLEFEKGCSRMDYKTSLSFPRDLAKVWWHVIRSMKGKVVELYDDGVYAECKLKFHTVSSRILITHIFNEYFEDKFGVLVILNKLGVPRDEYVVKGGYVPVYVNTMLPRRVSKKLDEVGFVCKSISISWMFSKWVVDHGEEFGMDWKYINLGVKEFERMDSLLSVLYDKVDELLRYMRW